MSHKDLHLTDLIDPKDWQNIQNSLSDVLGVPLRTFNPDGDLLTKTSNPVLLCTKILPKVYKSSNLLTSCLLGDRVAELKDIKKESPLKCYFGMEAFVIPIRAAGTKIAAYIILGPIILKARKSISEYAKEIKRLSLSTEEVEDALLDINVFSYNKINAMVRLIKDVFSHIAQTGYHKKRLGEIKPEVMELDPLFSRYYEDKILSSLLKTCTIALNADSGSVMTLDRSTNELHIKVASELDEQIVDNTNIKVGEGIAGVAAATSESFILPKDEIKNGLANKMKRKYIKSSMVVPFSKADTHDVYGVINLNVTRKTKEFSDKDIALTKELINMASTALIPLRQKGTEEVKDST